MPHDGRSNILLTSLKIYSIPLFALSHAVKFFVDGGRRGDTEACVVRKRV